MKTIEVEIQGVSPILMHRFSEQDRAQIEAGSSHTTARATPQEQAERAAYRLGGNGRANLYLPSQNLLASLRRAASYHKIGRRSAVTAVCAGVFISPDALDFGTSTFETDARSVVIAATRGRVMRYRPKLSNWKLKFTLEFDEKIIPSGELVRSIVDDAGSKVGVGDFRPEKRGSFGRFLVTLWEA